MVPKHIGHLRRQVQLLLVDTSNELTPLGRETFTQLYDDLVASDTRIHQVNTRLKQICSASEVCKRLVQLEGIGPLIATAMVAAGGDPTAFKNGRQLAAWLGLVPRQHSSGDRQRLLGISKRGDRYLRTLLIHGARAVVWRAGNKTDARNQWIANKRSHRGMNRTCVAVANKNARIIWALLAKGEAYRRAA